MGKQIMLTLRGDYDVAAETRKAPERTDDDRENARRQTEKLLALFEREPNRWWDTSELVTRVSHRFSTSMQTLRDRGYVIDKRRVPGKAYEYRVIGFDATLAVTKKMESSYYTTQHWRMKASERRAFDGNRCCMCGSHEELTVHHWRYDLFAERLCDIMTLCRGCHDGIHANASITIRFPKRVAMAIANQLKAEANVDQST